MAKTGNTMGNGNYGKDEQARRDANAKGTPYERATAKFAVEYGTRQDKAIREGKAPGLSEKDTASGNQRRLGEEILKSVPRRGD